MSDFVFDVSKVQSSFTSKSFERSRPEPRSDVFFEFRVETATMGQARFNETTGKGGHLQLTLRVAALDSEGDIMFQKFLNIAHPAVYEGHAPNEYAPGIWAASISALHPEWYPYDTVAAHPTNNKKKIYTREGVEVSRQDMDKAEKNRAAGVAAVAAALVSDKESVRQEALADLVGRKFFAKVQPDKTGQYVNVRPMIAILTEGEHVCYDSKEAYGSDS